MIKKGFIKSIVTGFISVAMVASSSICAFAEDDYSTSGMLSASDIVTGALNLAEDTMEEETDFGYDANLNITFGEGITNLMEMELKPIDIGAKINSKGENTSADISIKYDSKALATLNAVYEGETGKMYLRVPELNDAYLSGTEADLEKLLESYFEDDYYVDDYEDEETIIDFSGIEFPSYDDTFSNIDIAALSDCFFEYVDFIAEKAPEGTDGEKLQGEIDGNAYSFDTKVYALTGNDIYDIAKDVIEKLKADTNLKELVAGLGMDEAAYNEEIENLEYSIDNMTAADLKAAINVEMYYNNGELAGLSVNQNNVDVLKLIVLNTDDVFALDIYSYDEYLEEATTITGSCVPSYGKVNGVFKQVVTDNEYYTDTTTVTLTDLGLELGVLQGGIKIEKVSDWVDEEPTTTVYDFNSNSTVLKTDFSLKVTTDGEDYITLSFTGEEFEPVDVVIPTENVYSFADDAQLLEYLAGCDVDGFMANIENVLGEELYGLIEELLSVGNDDPDDDSSITEDPAIDPSPDDESKTDLDVDSKVDVTGNKTDDSSKADNKQSASTNKTTSTGSDKSVNTGVASGLAVVAIGLAGVAVIISKKK